MHKHSLHQSSQNLTLRRKTSNLNVSCGEIGSIMAFLVLNFRCGMYRTDFCVAHIHLCTGKSGSPFSVKLDGAALGAYVIKMMKQMA